MTKNLILTLILSFLLLSCNAIKPKKVDSRNQPTSGIERAKKNVAEGGGASVGSLLGNRGGSFEFSSSNPMWRASLEVLDFIPMTTVDYSGGMIISDWYNDNNVKGDESIKISIRFLSNEVRSDSLKIIIHNLMKIIQIVTRREIVEVMDARKQKTYEIPTKALSGPADYAKNFQ